jgi:NADH:ubiquinone oxidoreductase subunit 4 (subunit M)
LSHSFSSIALFLLIGLIINKTYSRYIDSIYFLSLSYRIFLFIFILANLSIPGSLNFIGELLAFISVLSIDYIYIIVFLFISILGACF